MLFTINNTSLTINNFEYINKSQFFEYYQSQSTQNRNFSLPNFNNPYYENSSILNRQELPNNYFNYAISRGFLNELSMNISFCLNVSDGIKSILTLTDKNSTIQEKNIVIKKLFEVSGKQSRIDENPPKTLFFDIVKNMTSQLLNTRLQDSSNKDKAMIIFATEEAINCLERYCN